jgi:hypothetical protein
LLRIKVIPDPRTSWMSLGLRKSIRWRDALNYRELGFRDVRRTIAGLIRSAVVVSLIEISIQEYFA